ncbi:MAG: hypothetical protein HYV96_12920 [Opitutae bacterium]|nr:hypothetical protein [Opitutae bacterium]
MDRSLKIARSLLFSASLTVTALASERAIVSVKCPLDGTEFEAVQDFSGYAEGQRLDLKKLGPISQPPALARCPQCSFPIFSKYLDAPLATRIRAILAGERFRTEAVPAKPWFALGILREELGADPFEIGWTYLNATWEAEDEGGRYAPAAERALAWFERAAEARRDDPERRRDCHVALYLAVELSRRLGRFDEARQKLTRLDGVVDEELRWLASAKAAQARLIAARKSAPDDGREDLPPPPR